MSCGVRFGTTREGDAILFARSTDGGQSFTKAQFVPSLGVGQYAPFDQNTTSRAIGSATTTFRTVGFPAIAFADDGYMYLAVSQVPGGTLGTIGGRQARITLMRTDGASWEGPTEVVAQAAEGQQFMPALAYAAGRLQLIWYDLRFDETGLTNEVLIDDHQALETVQRRHTIDLLGAQALLPASAWPPTFQPYGVSQPDYNDPPSPMGPPLMRGPRISQYVTGDRDPANPDGGDRQLRFNRANLEAVRWRHHPVHGRLHRRGARPISARWHWWLAVQRSGEQCAANRRGPRDVPDGLDRQPGCDDRAGDDGSGDAAVELHAALCAPLGRDDRRLPLPGRGRPGVVDNTQTRDANVYTSRITQDFSLTAPGNAKPTNTPGVVRTFAIQLANNRELTPPPPSGPEPPETPTRFKLELSSASASFSRNSFTSSLTGGTCGERSPPVQTIFVNVLPRSSIARTVYVRCGTAAAASVVVTATEMISNVPGATASVGTQSRPVQPADKGSGRERAGSGNTHAGR